MFVEEETIRDITPRLRDLRFTITNSNVSDWMCEGILTVRFTDYGSSVTRKSLAIRYWISLIALYCLVQPSIAQQKLDQLLVYGDDFIFSIKEPPGWKGDVANAEKFQSNVILHENGQPPESFSGLIRIRVNEKADENTAADLAEDMRGYKARYPKIQFKDLAVENPMYRCLGKVFYVPGEFYEYVMYVNPGKGRPLLFSASMSSEKSEANEKELDAYKSAVRSITLLKP